MPAPKPTLDAFGAMVRAARQRRGWTQEALAVELGSSQPFVSDLECGVVVDIGSVLVAKLARILGLDPRDQIVAAVERAA